MQQQILRRVLLWLGIGILLAVALNEGSFFFLRSEAGRAPRAIELLIPAGTAERMARGEASPEIPADMVFVIGDTLVVRNEDSVAHRLGPLFVPAGTSASMKLDRAENFIFECSFQPSNYFGLDVREPVTWETRIYGILFAGVPLGLLLSLYSFLIWPLRPSADGSKAGRKE
ncbi:MAG: hypothetical protein N2117_03520 [Anaerolineales bacterium]|nr:hypothetical protein [Anaerolineales bacterium]MCX7754302.1 hypothetical protein [Anaerolineales bacterium]MDW8278663.1 hypothetical protein [Anaerolineales bacterium]